MKSKLEMLAVAACFCAASTVLAGLSIFRSAPAPTVAAAPAAITGDYVEARTASVFCGACHYNGELMTTGHDAVMAWKFDGGTYQGVSLKGVRAMAAVTCDENLSLGETPHKTQLVVDTGASSQQVAAVAALIREKCGSQLGQIVEITRAPIAFTHNDTGYQVSGEGFATLDVSYRTDNSCCVQPGLVWYDPLSPISHRMVGYTESVAFTGSIAPPWCRTGEDSAFYGPIAF